MPLWGWLLIGVALGLVALWTYSVARRRPGPLDPALVVRGDVDRSADRKSRRRAYDIRLDDPGW